MRYKKNVALKVNYVALHRTTGLLDLDMKVYDEAGVLFTTVTMAAVPSNGGAYYGSFTPDAKGQWRIRIQSPTNNDDIQKVFEVGDSDIDEVKLQTQSIEDKEDIIDANVDQAILDIAAAKAVIDATKIVVDSVETKVDIIDSNVDLIKTETDKIQTIDDNVDAVKITVDSTETKVDIIDTVVDATKIVVDSIETKTDVVDTNVDQALIDIAAIKLVVDDIDDQISSGGYIMN